MAQDIDVARVAAALRAPVIRYRNFGNVPVRGTFQPPSAESVPDTPDLDAALAEAAALQREEEARATPLPAPQPPVLTDPHLDFPNPARMEEVDQPKVEKLDIAAVSWADSAPSLAAVQPEVVMPVPAAAPPLPPPQVEWTSPAPISAPKPFMAAPDEERPLLEVLREASLQPATAQHGLLALLAQPAVWDRPAAPPGMVPGPLSGQPIATDTGGLLSSAGFGAAASAPPAPYQDFVPHQELPQPFVAPAFVPAQEPPQPFVPQPAYASYQEPPQSVAQQPDFVPYQDPPQPFVQQPAYVPHQEPSQPLVQQQDYVPYQEPAQPFVQQPDFVPYQEPAQPFAQQPAYEPYQEPSQPFVQQPDVVPYHEPAQPYAPQPEATFQPQPAVAPATAATPLADVFRRVRTSAVQPAEAKQTVALHNVLRGLRAGRQD